jgi:hypothetical protein
MEALNRAGIVLLTAHLEGYIEDLFEEASSVVASRVFDTTHYDVKVFVTQATAPFRNPSPQNIKDLFARLGLPDVLAAIRWGTLSNDDIRKRLNELVQLRNKIAHGQRPSVTSSQLRREVSFARQMAKHLDKRLYDYVLAMAGVTLW